MATGGDRLSLEERIHLAFQPYHPALDLLDEWRRKRAYEREYITLACARLDAITNIATTRGPAETRFRNFVITYGAQKQLLNQISVADLYKTLLGYWFIVPGI